MGTPLDLPAGFQGSIVAQNYGATEQNGNGTFPGGISATTNDGGGGLISFVGTSRFGAAGSFPTNLDSLVSAYLAGTFEADATVPEPSTYLMFATMLAGVGIITIRKRRKKEESDVRVGTEII